MFKNVNKINRKIYKKCTRGKQNSVKSVEKYLIFGGVNPDGALSKITTLRKAIRESMSSVWMMQETKVSQQGQLRFEGFITYEHTRTEKDGGGVSISVLKDLNPAFVVDGGEAVEALTVNIHLKQITISCNTAYGPQESDPIDKKEKFWKYLDDEYLRAKNAGNGFVLQGDLNSWLGPNIIPGDTKPQNQNGKLFAQFVKQNQLIVVNSLPICSGTTTWTRTRLGIKLSSTIDFFVVCEKVLPFVTEMKIDHEGKHKITNFKAGKNITESDHIPMWMKVNIKVIPEKHEKIEIFNFKDEAAQQKFKINTSSTTKFSDCFNSKLPLEKQIDQWKHTLEKHCKTAFPIIRIRKKSLNSSPIHKLIDKRTTL